MYRIYRAEISLLSWDFLTADFYCCVCEKLKKMQSFFDDIRDTLNLYRKMWKFQGTRKHFQSAYYFRYVRLVYVYYRKRRKNDGWQL